MPLNLKQSVVIWFVLIVCFAIPRFLETNRWVEVMIGATIFLALNYFNNWLDKKDGNE